jgi:hypothetical protein
MKTQPDPLLLRFLLILTAGLLFACSFSNPFAGKGTGPVSFQSSPDLLTDPSTGLTDLKSYHAAFVQKVTGSLDGRPFERTTQIELTRLSGQSDFTRAIQGTEELPSFFRAILTDQAVYRWNTVDESCQGEAGALLPGETLEPAGLLLPVLKTTRVADETVNQIAAIHYRFDESGLALTAPKPSVSGEFWLAEQGGYVVKYILNASKPSTTSGKGLEVGQSVVYELSQVNTVAALPLPKGCLPVPVDLPAMPDAANLTRTSGNVRYETASSAQKVVDLYYHDLNSLGWTTAEPQPTGDLKLPLGLAFSNGDERLSINLNTAETGGLEINLVVYNLADQAAALTPTPATVPTPAGPQPTIDPSKSGLPEDVPLYPGATNLQSLGGMGIEYTAPAAPDLVASFYRQQLAAAGWSLLTEDTSSGQTMQVWQKAKRVTSLQISFKDGQTDVLIFVTKQ